MKNVNYTVKELIDGALDDVEEVDGRYRFPRLRERTKQKPRDDFDSDDRLSRKKQEKPFVPYK